MADCRVYAYSGDGLVRRRRDFDDSDGSKASSDNAAIWASALGPLALLRSDSLVTAVRFLVVRAFSPVGFLLAVWGIFCGDRLWKVWALAALAGLAMVAGKLHHEYYWLALAPVAAAAVGRAIDDCKVAAFRLHIFAIFAAFAVWQSSSTFKTPAEWVNLPQASREITQIVPRESLLIAPEAVLFAADRRGCRLEFEPKAMARAAGEWRGSIDASDPLALVRFYHQNGAKFFADLTSAADPPSRRALHEAIRRRYNVKMDRDGVLIAELTDRPGTDPCPPPPRP